MNTAVDLTTQGILLKSVNYRCLFELIMIYLFRDSQLKTVLQEVTQADIPTELSERLAEEKRIETVS